MNAIGPYATPPWWLHGAHLARVTSVRDPEGLARVQVQVLAPDADAEALLWARVAVPFAGNNRGAFFIPDMDDEVLVVFAGGAARAPIVIGGLWNGAQAPPETLPGDAVDRWTITGKAGTRIAIVEESGGQEKVEIETPGGAKATLTDASGGSITFDVAGNTVTMDTQGVTVETAAKVKVSAAQVEVSAGMVKVDAGMSQFSGVVKCDTLITNSVVSTSYTPGAGNIW
jgi:uncharacterized protein involved in type VI secretion and phage assembly